MRGGGRRSPISPERFRAGLDAQRHRVRRLPASPPRHRPQQPRRVGAYDRRDPSPERRHAMAAARARRRTSRAPRRASRCAGGARRAARRSTSARPSRTTGSASSPRSSIARLPRLRGHICGGSVARSAELPGRLQQVRAAFPDCASSGRRNAARRARERVRVRRIGRGRAQRAPLRSPESAEAPARLRPPRRRAPLGVGRSSGQAAR